MKKQLIFHPILFAIAPVLYLYVVNVEQIALTEAANLFVLVAATAAVLWLALSWLFRDLNKAACLVSITVVTFLSYERVFATAAGAGQVLKLIVWLGWLFATAYLIARSRRDFSRATGFFNVVSLAWVASIAALWLYHDLFLTRETTARANAYLTTWQQEMSQPLAVDATPVSEPLPNIYYIILDGYGRADMLQSLYGYDNSSFLDFLKQKGFYVADRSVSNYAQTALSQASSMNFEYLDDLAQQLTPASSNRLPLAAMLKSNRLVQLLRRKGYQIVTFSTGYLFTDIGSSADRQLASAGGLTELQTELFRLTPLPSLSHLLVNQSLHDLYRERILYTLDHLPAAVMDDAPTLVYAHILAPHPPFVFGLDGEPIDADPLALMVDGSWFTARYGREAYVQGYRDQATFITGQVRQVIERILANMRRPTIIVIQGDHGPGSMLDWDSSKNTNFNERMSILNVYYFPDQDYASLCPGISPVNTFRVILKNYIGFDLPLLKDRSFFSTMTRPYEFNDVTDQVGVSP